MEIRFGKDLELDPPDEWRNELDQTLFPGGYFKEFIFFHRESESLIVADAIINIELGKMDEPWRTFARMSGMYYPRGQVFFGMRLPLLSGKGQLRPLRDFMHGGLAASCSAMGAASTWMETRLSGGFCETDSLHMQCCIFYRGQLRMPKLRTWQRPRAAPAHHACVLLLQLPI